jgi:hypothetical protein
LLLKDQNARLDQEGQFASIKEPRSLTIKKNKANEEVVFTARRGGTRWRPKPSPHPPLATFEPGPVSFQKNQRICGKGGRFEKKVADFRKKGWI